MNIYLHDLHTLRVETTYHPEIVERLKSLSEREYDKATKSWFVPVRLFDVVMEKFPLASVTYDALMAAWDAQAGRERTFYDSLVRWGIKLEIDASGAVCAVGETVSPLIQDLVAARAEALRPYAKSSPIQPQMQPDGARLPTEASSVVVEPQMRPATVSIAQDGWQQATLFA